MGLTTAIHSGFLNTNSRNHMVSCGYRKLRPTSNQQDTEWLRNIVAWMNSGRRPPKGSLSFSWSSIRNFCGPQGRPALFCFFHASRTYSFRSFQHDLLGEQICRRREQRKRGWSRNNRPGGVHLVRVCVKAHYDRVKIVHELLSQHGQVRGRFAALLNLRRLQHYPSHTLQLENSIPHINGKLILTTAVGNRDRLCPVVEGKDQSRFSSKDLHGGRSGCSLGPRRRHLRGSPPATNPDRPRGVAGLKLDPHPITNWRQGEEANPRTCIGRSGNSSGTLARIRARFKGS